MSIMINRINNNGVIDYGISAPFQVIAVVLILAGTIFALIGHCYSDHRTLVACGLFLLGDTLSRRVRSQQCNPQSSSRIYAMLSLVLVHVEMARDPRGPAVDSSKYTCYFPYLENPSVRVSLNNGEILTARTMDIRRVRSPLILGKWLEALGKLVPWVAVVSSLIVVLGKEDEIEKDKK
ncbi:hypothetical protein HZH68_005169 [Vespula germanica]|uniref:Uncharacterized protein n=1 Tax=Vespula germanica TaxID=30212 RepID=A0A834NEB4_VESGE|nr:hypothetical protein HZH68_005169 [Vespula germanica]